jgi:tetratricopeptide (TPR) repeat protein
VGLVRTLKPAISQEQFNLMSQQALEMARRFNDPLTLYDALYLKIWGDRRPEHSLERMNAMIEMLRLAESVGDMPKQLDVIGFRILENLELGDIQAVQADCVSQRRLMEKVQQPFYDYVTQLNQSTLAILAGNFVEAERIAIQALATGRQMKVGNADGMFGIQMFTIQREQGRLREIAPLVKLFVEQHTHSGTWLPGLALIYSELGMRFEALHEFESLAANDFTGIPNDSLWLTCIVYLSEVCAYLGDVDRAAYLYQLLLPHAGRSLVTGFSAVCYGAISRYLGLLAATMSRWLDAEQHFQEALELNSRLGAKPWLAHTQHLYGIMLLRRGDPIDRSRATAFLENALETAHQLGMKSLEEKIIASRHLVAP